MNKINTIQVWFLYHGMESKWNICQIQIYNFNYVNVNSTAGFSIIKWTGNGSYATIGHGLGTKYHYGIGFLIPNTN